MRDRCHDAQADAQHGRHEQCGQGELRRTRQHFENAVEHRPLAAQPKTQVAPHRVAGVVPVLNHKRPIEPVGVPELSRALRRQRLVPSEDLHRIARHQVEHQKTEHRDPNQHRHRLQQPLGQGALLVLEQQPGRLAVLQRQVLGVLVEARPQEQPVDDDQLAQFGLRAGEILSPRPALLLA